MRPRIRRTRQGWEVLRDGAILGPYRTRAEAERWARERPRRNPSEWQDEVGNEEDVSPYVREQMPDVVGRARSAGARPPLEYMGAGASGVVLCDARNRGYKVARTLRQSGGLADEAEWMQTARQVPGVREHVAAVYGFHPREGVIERECVRGKVAGWGQEGKLFDLHRGIERSMLQYGWGSPEFKGDSYVMVRGRGPVLVDAGMANRVGTNLARRAAAVLSGRATPRTSYEADMLPGEVRMELDRTIPRDKGEQLLRRIAPRDNPRPAAWSKLRGSTPYPCRAKAVGKPVRRQGREYTVESCATPTRSRPDVGQFWLVRPGVAGHAVPRPAVSRALRRGAKPPSEDLFARWGRRPPRFGPGTPEPSRPFAAPRPQQGAKLVGFREVETAELTDEWDGRVLQPSERWRVELWARSYPYGGLLHEAIAYRWHPEEGRWVNEAHADENAPYNGIISVVAHRSSMRMPPEAHDALDDVIRSKVPGLPYQRLERLAKGGLRISSGGRGAYAPRADNEFKDPGLQVAWRAYNARACIEEDRRGTREERRARELTAEHKANAALELACGQPGSLPPTKDCARFYGLLDEVWEGARCNVSELEEPPCPRRLTDDRLGAWARGEEPFPPRGPYDVHTEHQAGGAGGCCAFAEPQVRRASLHRRTLANLAPGEDPEEAMERAEGYEDKRHRELWAKCDERVRREVEKRRAVLATGAEGAGGETGLDLLLGWWRAARKGDYERALLLGGRAISEGYVKGEPGPGWELEPGEPTMLDGLLQELEDAGVSSQRKRAVLTELERGGAAISESIRERTLRPAIRREALHRAQMAKSSAWKRGR